VFVVLLLLFIVVPIAEIYVIIQVGEAIGALPTIGLLILDSTLGAALLRSQGRAVWRRFNAALGAGRPPAREVLDGALVLLGGALLIAPGFLTDIVGVLCLLPPTRALVRRIAVRSLRLGFVMRVAGARRPPPRRPAYDVDGSAVDLDRPPHGLGR
jgi:UPF0716 protein FxsA